MKVYIAIAAVAALAAGAGVILLKARKPSDTASKDNSEAEREAVQPEVIKDPAESAAESKLKSQESAFRIIDRHAAFKENTESVIGNDFTDELQNDNSERLDRVIEDLDSI